MLEIIEQRFKDQKEAWESAIIKGKIFECNTANRIGDEIQLSALYKYLKTKKININYQDGNRYISMLNVFPENIVNFVRNNSEENTTIDLVGVWNWAPFLRANKFYTESQIKYDNSKIEFDCVFIPYIKPNYYFERELKNSEEVFQQILLNFPNSICIIDSNKKNEFKLKDRRVVFSDNIYTTFKYIEKSKYYIGCDTGTTHYAGSINHPRMILLYPSDNNVLKVIMWQRYAINFIYKIQEILEYNPSSAPCCDPNNFRIITFNQTVDPKYVVKKIKQSF
jgi:hypothetical protein